MEKVYNKYGTIVLVAIIFILSYLIVKPFILTIIATALIAYIFYPVTKFIQDRIKNKSLTALIMCFLVFLLVVVPFFLFLQALIREIPTLYTWATAAVQNSRIWHDVIYERLFVDFGVSLDIRAVFASLTTSALVYLQNIIVSIPAMLINISIGVFILYFFFRDGTNIVKNFVSYLPVKHKDTIILVRELKKMIDAVIYGQLVTALVQALLATFAYAVLGVNAPLFWGLLTFIFAIIPIIGPWTIYGPMGISMVITALDASDTFGLIKGIILLIFGFGIVSTVDNLLRPVLIGDKVRMHPILILVGVLGGIYMYGFLGIVLGPLILIILSTIFNIYKMKQEMVERIEHRKPQ
jgi:predicted PurR-regulated permease PerM